MTDLANLAKFYYPGQATVGNLETAVHLPWWVENAAPPTKPEKDFLLQYLLHYCQVCFKAGKPITQDVLDKLLKVAPEDGELNFWQAVELERQEDMAQAFEFYERAAALAPDKPTYMIAAAKIAVALGKRHKAMAMLAGVIDTFPNIAQAYHERGKIYEQDENWARAKREYENCVSLDQKSVDYLCDCARIYRQLKQYKAAQRLLRKALSLDPQNKQAQEEMRHISLFDQMFDFSRPDDPSAQI